MADNDASTWAEALTWFSVDEQVAAFDRYWRHLTEDSRQRDRFKAVRRRLARQVKFRPESLDRLAAEKRARLLVQHFGVLEEIEWGALFRHHFLNAESGLLCRFLDLLGIAHDEQGVIQGSIEQPDESTVASAVRLLREEGYAADRVFRYLAVLILTDSSKWRVLQAPKKRLFEEIRDKAKPAEEAQLGEPAVAESRTESLEVDEFTTLDRVLIEKIVDTAADVEGALGSEALEDLIQTVVALNSQRKRNFYHLGLMDVLVTGVDSAGDRSELNDQRKGWYLAGALVGYVRRRDDAAFGELLRREDRVFRSTAASSGDAGLAMARNLYEYLIETARIDHARQLVQGQAPNLSAAFFRNALADIARLLQQNDVASAQSLCDAIRYTAKGSRRTFNPELVGQLERRHGQCLQRLGDFRGSLEIFQALLEHDYYRRDAYLLADVGMVHAGFTALSDIAVPEGVDAKATARDALVKGKEYFERAVEVDPENAVNAHYALGILAYLEAAQADEQMSAVALQHIQRAVSGMHGSPFSEIYRVYGIFGQAQFVQAVLNMERLEADGANRAASAWSGITEAAGGFPVEDLKRLLEAAEAVDEQKAIEIAESIFEFGNKRASEELVGATFLARSNKIREHYLELARDENRDSESRWQFWSQLVPALIRVDDKDTAIEGLDQMEECAERTDLAACMEGWLEHPKNYDPAWDESEALWARVRLARKSGNDHRCVGLWPTLFYKLRDDDPGAAFEFLQQGRAWRLNLDVDSLEKSLPTWHDEADKSQDWAAHLRDGAGLTVIFVGGNEIQARYDDRVKDEINADWPGVAITFRHTGWSSNWGRELPGLIQECNEADAVVLMSYMRTLLGKRLRAALVKPWIACTGTGQQSIVSSIRRASRVAMESAHP